MCVNLPGYFRCECPDQFTGERCEIFRLITCENQPCKNGGSCTDIINPQTGDNFTCTCTTGYEGSICDVPYCIGQKCQNGGKCDFLYQVYLIFITFFFFFFFAHITRFTFIYFFKYFPNITLFVNCIISMFVSNDYLHILLLY